MPEFSRRGFLKSLIASASAATIGSVLGFEIDDPEKLIWTPGEKTILIPDKTIVEASSIQEALRKSLRAVLPSVGLPLSPMQRWAHVHGGVAVQDDSGEFQYECGALGEEEFMRKAQEIEAMGGFLIGRQWDRS